jgi:hypothetical protein
VYILLGNSSTPGRDFTSWRPTGTAGAAALVDAAKMKQIKVKDVAVCVALYLFWFAFVFEKHRSLFEKKSNWRQKQKQNVVRSLLSCRRFCASFEIRK